MKKGWEIKKLGEVCEVITKGTTPTSIGYKFVNKGINFIKIESLSESGNIIQNKVAYIDEKCHQTMKRSQLKENDILFSIAGALGRIGIIKKEILPANTNQALGIIRLKKDSNILIEFLAKYFISKKITDIIEHLRMGVAQQNLSLAQLNNLPIPLPPLSEQQQIVSILDKCFAAIDKAKENAEKNLKNAKELFESYLQGVFEKKGEEWEERKLGEIGNISMCKRILKHQTSINEEIPFYKIGTFGKDPDAFISKKLYMDFRNRFSYPKKGDILLSASGTIGRKVIYDGAPAYFQDSNIVWVDNNENKILNCFLFYCYSVANWKTAKGATISRLYNYILEKETVCFPKSFEEQKQLVKIFENYHKQTQKLEAIYRKKIDDLEELKKAILQKAFGGELKMERK